MKERFMAQGEQVLTRIILEHCDKRYILETPYSDSAPLEDLLDLAYAALLAAGYHQDTIDNALVELAEEKGYKRDEDEN
jgi:hypothetical protein